MAIRRPIESKKIRYAVVGLGYISQVAVLPAFEHAAENSALAAFVSSDPAKHEKLGRHYGVQHHFSYDDYDALLTSGTIDAVYIALPNSMHCNYAVRAARAGIHVLCEKPMAMTEKECQRMIDAADETDVKLMIAYRLHFEEANLKAIEIARSGKLGEIRFFSSVFGQQVKPTDIRLKKELGGGTVWDMGVYCINAARYLFQEEPIQVAAFSAKNGEMRFAEVDEMTSALLRFSDDRLAVFTSSFNSGEVSQYRIVGTKGDLTMQPAYDYNLPLKSMLTIDGNSKIEEFPRRDQFAAELIYFSNCILTGQDPEPSGAEGLADVRVVRAIYQSAETGQPVALGPFDRDRRPDRRQAIKRPPVRKPELVHAESPSGR